MPSNLSGEGIAARQELLQSSQTLGTTVHAILLDRFGQEIYDWEPVTVALECKAEFECEPCTTVMDRWCAIQVAMCSNAFFRRIDAFLGICNTLASGEPYADMFDPVTVEEAAWGIAEIGMNRDFLPFSPTIKAYIRTVSKEDGYNKDAFHPIFDQVFDATPSENAIRNSLATLGNTENIDRYIKENIQDMASQFNRIPDLKNVDNEIISKGLHKALRDNT